MVRVFDEKLDAQTFLYTGGESRNIVAGPAAGCPGRARVPGRPVVPGRADRAAAGSLLPRAEGFVRRRVAQREAAVAAAEPALARSRERAAGQPRSDRGRVALGSGNPRAFADPRSDILAFAEAAPPAPGADQGPRRGRGSLAEPGRRRGPADLARLDLAALRARIAADAADPRFGKPTGDFESLRRRAARAERAAADRAGRARAGAGRAEPWPRRGAKAGGRGGQGRAVPGRGAEDARDGPDGARSGPGRLHARSARSTPPGAPGRRAALARWITDRANPLTARVAVNHLWRWHFGTPLVATTHDFGRNGSLPDAPRAARLAGRRADGAGLTGRRRPGR